MLNILSLSLSTFSVCLKKQQKKIYRRNKKAYSTSPHYILFYARTLFSYKTDFCVHLASNKFHHNKTIQPLGFYSGNFGPEIKSQSWYFFFYFIFFLVISFHISRLCAVRIFCKFVYTISCRFLVYFYDFVVSEQRNTFLSLYIINKKYVHYKLCNLVFLYASSTYIISLPSI